YYGQSAVGHASLTFVDAAAGNRPRPPAHNQLCSVDARPRLVAVAGPRRWQRPFERGGAHSPGIGWSMHPTRKRLGDAVQEHEQTGERDVRAERGDEVPTCERIGIVGDAARHAGETEKVHREEGEVGTDEHQPEMQLADG